MKMESCSMTTGKVLILSSGLNAYAPEAKSNAQL
jgi:hypothetical protein